MPEVEPPLILLIMESVGLRYLDLTQKRRTDVDDFPEGDVKLLAKVKVANVLESRRVLSEPQQILHNGLVVRALNGGLPVEQGKDRLRGS